jgi:signal recognition particle receptor subunit beta
MISFFTEMSDVPFVVAANKVAADDIVRLQQMRADLELDASAPLLPVDARDRNSVKAVLLGLLYEILESMGE